MSKTRVYICVFIIINIIKNILSKHFNMSNYITYNQVINYTKIDIRMIKQMI